MTQKPVLYIYERRELMVLVLISAVFALMLFTVGIHYGVKVATSHPQRTPLETNALETGNDALPSRQELAEQAKKVGTEVEDALDKTVSEEVSRTGIRLDQSRPVTLPEKTKSRQGGATTLSPPKDTYFSLQIGSYSSKEEADQRATTLKNFDLSPFTREVEVSGKGKWYRVYLGRFKTKAEAKQSGDKLVRNHVVESFVVAPVTDSPVADSAPSQ